MAKFAVIKTGSKQYLVKANDEIVVDKIITNDKKLELDTLITFDNEKNDIEIGSPILKTRVTAEIIEEGKGEKIRVAKFKAKVRYRKVMGFRPVLTKLKILSI